LGLVLALLLFLSLFAALAFIFVPAHAYDVVPAAAAADVARRRIEQWLVGGRKHVLRTLAKSAAEVVRTGIFVGAMLSVLAFALTVKFLGALAVLPVLLFFFAGILLTRLILENEYRTWQASFCEGMPQLVNFMPAFLEIEGVTPREALQHSIPFVPEPLRQEMWKALDRIKRTARIKETMMELARKSPHPLVEAVFYRLSASWDAAITPGIFADLNDEVENMKELAVTRATTAKTGYLALICVLGMLGGLLVYGYPAYKFLMEKLTGGFGF